MTRVQINYEVIILTQVGNTKTHYFKNLKKAEQFFTKAKSNNNYKGVVLEEIEDL